MKSNIDIFLVDCILWEIHLTVRSGCPRVLAGQEMLSVLSLKLTWQPERGSVYRQVGVNAKKWRLVTGAFLFCCLTLQSYIRLTTQSLLIELNILYTNVSHQDSQLQWFHIFRWMLAFRLMHVASEASQTTPSHIWNVSTALGFCWTPQIAQRLFWITQSRAWRQLRYKLKEFKAKFNISAGD